MRYIMVAGGYPHSIQMIGHNLVELDKDGYIDEDDWNNATALTALHLQTKGFADLYNFEGRRGIKELILDILAVKGIPLAKKELKTFCGDKNIYQYIPELVKGGEHSRNGRGR
jgi:hypothetical protein